MAMLMLRKEENQDVRHHEAGGKNGKSGIGGRGREENKKSYEKRNAALTSSADQLLKQPLSWPLLNVSASCLPQQVLHTTNRAYSRERNEEKLARTLRASHWHKDYFKQIQVEHLPSKTGKPKCFEKMKPLSAYMKLKIFRVSEQISFLDQAGSFSQVYSNIPKPGKPPHTKLFRFQAFQLVEEKLSPCSHICLIALHPCSKDTIPPFSIRQAQGFFQGRPHTFTSWRQHRKMPHQLSWLAVIRHWFHFYHLPTACHPYRVKAIFLRFDTSMNESPCTVEARALTQYYGLLFPFFPWAYEIWGHFQKLMYKITN